MPALDWGGHSEMSYNTKIKSNRFILNHKLSERCSIVKWVTKEKYSESLWFRINLLDFNLVLWDILLIEVGGSLGAPVFIHWPVSGVTPPACFDVFNTLNIGIVTRYLEVNFILNLIPFCQGLIMKMWKWLFPPTPVRLWISARRGILLCLLLFSIIFCFGVFNFHFCSLSPKENLSGSFDDAKSELFFCEESSDKSYNQREKY